MKKVAGLTALMWAVAISGILWSAVSHATEASGQKAHSQKRTTSGDTPQNYPADNTGRNVRDRSDTAVTAGDQGNQQPDVKITQQVRRAIVKDKELSTDAHNVKIITRDGVVTLRGPVKDDGERAKIAAKAKHVTGVTRVENELEVASQ